LIGGREENKPGGPRALGGLIRDFVRTHRLSGSAVDARIFKAWNEVLEPSLRAHAEPVRFRNRELTVETDSAVHFQELNNFTGEEYRSAANERLGSETIQRVVFKLKV
jgi:hypothetical protein